MRNSKYNTNESSMGKNTIGRNDAETLAVPSNKYEGESVLTSLFHAFVIPSAICAAGVAFLWALPANSQTLKCGNAKTTAEFTICNSENLMVLDERLEKVYVVAFADQATKPQQQALSRKHNHWLIKRASCGGDSICLSTLYKTHIETVSGSVKSSTNLTAFSAE